MRQWWAANNDINNRRAAAPHGSQQRIAVSLLTAACPPVCLTFHGAFKPFQKIETNNSNETELVNYPHLQ